MTYDTEVLADNPLSYWKLNETSGTVATDSGSLANNGTYTGGYTLHQTSVPPGLDAAVLLNGSTGYVDCGNPTALNLSRSFTVECVVKVGTSSSTTFSLISHGAGGFYFRLNGGSHPDWLKSQVTDLLSLSSISLNDNNWHHLAATVDSSGNIVIYVDGYLAGSLNNSTTYSSSNTIKIGAETGGNGSLSEFLNGNIGRVAIYGTPLSLSRIQAHYFALGLTTDLRMSQEIIEIPSTPTSNIQVSQLLMEVLVANNLPVISRRPTSYRVGVRNYLKV